MSKAFKSRGKTCFKLIFLLFPFAFLVFTLPGCSPTYPKEKFKDSIIRVCKQEYKTDVKVETTEKTIAIYLPLTDLIDFTFAITKAASEKINDVILTVSRVALSTDAKFDFYCVIAHDVRMPEIQIVIIKSVDDIKRFLLNDISRGEYSKRMLIDIRFSPQAQKERAIKDVFDKMKLEANWQEQVLNDFFRSEPSGLSDIGYWNDRFYVKDVSLPEFLAEQIASRVRMEFREDKKLADRFFLKLAKGTYAVKDKAFKFEVMADRRMIDYGADTINPNAAAVIFSEDSATVFRAAVNVTADVLRGYKFTDFDHIEILNQKDRTVLRVTRENLELLRKKKITFEDVLKQSF